MGYLPSKNFFIVLCVVLFAGAGLFWFTHFYNTNTITQKELTKQEKARLIQDATAKTIEDVLGSNDTSTTTLIAQALYYDEVAQTKGTAGVEYAKEKLTEEISAAKANILNDRYTAKDIHTTNDNSIAALRNYGNKVGDIFMHSGDKITTPHYTELKIIEQGIGENHPEILAQLDLFITFYQTAINNLLATPVPSSATSIHIKLLNALNSLMIVDQGFRGITDDASKAAASLYGYPDASKKMVEGVNAAKALFQQKGIVFSSEEDGYSLINSI